MLATDKRILAGHAAGAAEMVGPSDEGGVVSDRDKGVGATAQLPAQSSVACTTKSISQALLYYLRIEGVRKVFGIPGAGVMDIAYELRQQPDTFQYIICRHESGAAYIADGYSRVTGELGVVLVTSGPGASNALTGAMNAEADGSPLLTITGEIESVYDGKGYLQSGIDGRLNIDQIFAAATDYSAVVTTPASATTLIAQALRDACGLPHHAAHLSIPLDVQKSTLPPSVTLPTSRLSYRTIPASTDPAGIAQMFETLIAASYPLIMLGNSCRRLLQGEPLLRFIAFVEKFGIPVITSADGKAVFPETNLWSLRNYGIAACEWPQYYLRPCTLDATLPEKFDALAVLGSQLGEFATHKWDRALIPSGPFMQVDLDPSVIGRGYYIDLGIVAEVGQVIAALCDLGDQRAADTDTVAQRAAFIKKIKQQSPWRDRDDRISNASPVKPPTLMKLIEDLTPEGSCIFVDCANAVGWSLGYLALDPPTEIHLALSVAPLGFAIGGVIGARIGRPDATCVALVGDGAFLMHGSEVSTAATYGVGAIWIILDDNNLTMVNQGMDQYYPQAGDWSNYYEFNKPDLAMMAKALGADTYSVSNPMEFEPAYLEAIRVANAENRPQVIVVKTDATLIPPFFPPTNSAVEKPPDAATPAGPKHQEVTDR
jgi:acetolactate synthase I/II/III large subunit